MNVLMVMAHPDDEVLFGWPLLQDRAVKGLLTMAHNGAKYGDGPVKALQEVVDENGATLTQLPMCDTNAYRLPTRYVSATLMSSVSTLIDAVQRAMLSTKADVIFTHNPVGEYGHGDHRLLFSVIASLDVPMLMTDVCFSNKCHVSYARMPAVYERMYAQSECVKKCVLDAAWYERMRAIYEKHRAWSWARSAPVSNCSLFLFK